MLPEESTTSEKSNRWLKFLGGFLGWFLVNTLIYALINLEPTGNASRGWLVVLALNLVALVVLIALQKTRMIGLGIGGALVVNFLLTLLFSSPQDAYDFIPFPQAVFDAQPTPLPANQLPVGSHQGNAGRANQDKCTAFGWATDPDDRNMDLTVQVLSDGVVLTTQEANLIQADLDTPNGCPGGSCAFEFKLWDWISHDQAHTIVVQAQDAQTGEWITLDHSTQKLSCLTTGSAFIETLQPPAPTSPPTPVEAAAAPSYVGGENRVKFTSGNRYLIVEFLDDDLAHFELSAAGSGASVDKPIYTTPMIYKKDYPGPTSLSDDGHGTLETSDLRIRVDPESLCLTATDKTKEPDLTLTTLCPLNLDQAWKGFTLTAETFTHAYGLGQQFTTEGDSSTLPGGAGGDSNGDWVGRARLPIGDMGNTLTGWRGGMVGNTQFPVAYFTGEGLDSYALFLDSQYRQSWDFRETPWKAEMWGNWIRFYLMTGPDLPDLRGDYLELTGHPLVPPKKMFGLWVSEYGFDNWAELEDKLRTLRANHFPVDGFVLDLQWFGGIRSGSDDSWMGSLTWDLTHFPDPQAKIAQYKEDEGVGIIVIEESYISKGLEEHAQLESLGYLVRECQACEPVYLDTNSWWGKGGMMDWTNPAAGAFWHDWKREPLLDAGVIGHWTDLGEPEMYESQSWYWGMEGDYLPLHAQWDVHNLYNLLWSQSIYEGYLRNQRANRPFILSRSGAPGSQRYGVSMWSGDIGSNLSSLATHLNAQMHMSLSGMDYYGADIGGFHRGALDGDLDEMYTQWFANGAAFDLPVRAHTENLCNCKETAPDRIGDLESNLANLRLRYALSPYLYSLSHRAYLYGEPLFPPLVYYYQGDLEVRELGNEKLLGRDLLAATVASYGVTEREVYLPAGDWIDYYTHEWIHSTGAWFGPFPVTQQGLFRLPLFARAGAILPLMYVDDQTMNILGKREDGGRRDELILRVYPDPAPSSFTLYEDDGETTAYQNGEVRTTLLSQQQTPDSVTVTIGEASGSYAGALNSRDNVIQLVVEGSANIAEVLLNGEPLAQYDTQDEFEAASSGWVHAEDGLILAKSGDMEVGLEKGFEFRYR